MLLSKWRGTILIFGVQRCNHTLYIGHQIQIRMRDGSSEINPWKVGRFCRGITFMGALVIG
jgi:hypothetical protein